MKIPLRIQLDLFTPAAPPAEMSGEERLKAVVLLQSLLVEAVSAPSAELLSIRNQKEADDEQDHH